LAEIYLDATDSVLGRLASYVAKRALEGDKVYVFNAEKAVILGDKKAIFEKYWKLRADIGNPLKGPYYPKMPHLIVKRAIRGMLPRKKPRGRDALSRVIVHIGVPKEFKDKELKTVYKFDENKALKYIRVADLAKHLGWKGE